MSQRYGTSTTSRAPHVRWTPPSPSSRPSHRPRSSRQHHAGVRRPGQPDPVVPADRPLDQPRRVGDGRLHDQAVVELAPCRSTRRRDSRCPSTAPGDAVRRRSRRRLARRCASSPAAPRPRPRRAGAASAACAASEAARRPRSRSRVRPVAASITRAFDQVDVADEVGDPARVRLLVDLGRRARPATIRPWSITPMRSATVIASSWSWVTMTKVRPSLSCSSHQLELRFLAQLLVERRQRLVEQQHASAA